jgi:GT2 family glycosyltransferase
MQAPVTVICPATRYETTLPLAIQSIVNQTINPVRIIIICDGEQNYDFKKSYLFNYIFELAKMKGITIDVAFSGGNKGVVYCYNEILKMIQTPLVYRIDDDEVAEPNCLEQLIHCLQMDKSIGAVGPSVYVPGMMICPKPNYIKGTINQIKNYPSVQWFTDNKYSEVEQLHSTFLFRMDLASPYPYSMSQMSFREETVFSYQIFKKGFKLMVNPQAIVWHYKAPAGARSGNAVENQANDELKFDEWAKQYNITFDDKLECIAFNHALGDNIVLKNNLDKIKQFYKSPLYIASNFPEVYSGVSGIIAIPMHESSYFTQSISIYNWMATKNWSGTMNEAVVTMLTEGRACQTN